MHLRKIATYGAGELLTGTVLLYGVALTPATLLGAWVGKRIIGRISDRVFVLLVEIGLLAAGVLFLLVSDPPAREAAQRFTSAEDWAFCGHRA